MLTHKRYVARHPAFERTHAQLHAAQNGTDTGRFRPDTPLDASHIFKETYKRWPMVAQPACN
jgi:hypothetical protein